MSHTNIIKRLDAMCFEIIKQRDVVCQRCGSSQNLVPAHVFAKKPYPNLRHDTLNLLLLCNDCHQWWHNNLENGWQWFCEKWPERVAYLMVIKNESRKLNRIFYEDKVKELKAIKETL